MNKLIRTASGKYVNLANIVQITPGAEHFTMRDSRGDLHRVSPKDLPRSMRRLG